jgi:hypothetical protein
MDGGRLRWCTVSGCESLKETSFWSTWNFALSLIYRACRRVHPRINHSEPTSQSGTRSSPCRPSTVYRTTTVDCLPAWFQDKGQLIVTEKGRERAARSRSGGFSLGPVGVGWVLQVRWFDRDVGMLFEGQVIRMR